MNSEREQTGAEWLLDYWTKTDKRNEAALEAAADRYENQGDGAWKRKEPYGA